MQHVQLVRGLEQDSVLVFRAALRRERGPGRIPRRQADFQLVLRFRLQPVRYVRRERQLGQRLAEAFRQVIRDGVAVDRRGLLRGHSAGRSTESPPLHEFALDRIQRCQLVFSRLQCRKLRPDPEQSPDEIFQVRRQLNDQLRLRLNLHRRMLAPGRE